MSKAARLITSAIAAALLLGASSGTSPASLTERQRALHVLNRLGFGARPADVEKVLAIGVEKYVRQQLHPERIEDTAVNAKLERYETLKRSERDLLSGFVEARQMRGERRPNEAVLELTAARITRAIESNRQLEEVMVDFWMNHFNVFAGKGPDRVLIAAYERDTIRPHLWGRFEDLLMATAKSPAMLFYLDNARSRAGGINENYARELLELHTFGVDGGYTQKDVTELARLLTGWSIARPRERRSGFVFRSALHDSKPKTILGKRYPAGGGLSEGEAMIRYLATHPSTARHVATKLCRRFVSDDPPLQLVNRVAKRFLDTRGDLRETVRAVVTSPEFLDPRYYGAKVKTPFEYVVSSVRAVDATIINPLPLARTLRQMGQPLYFAQPPTGYAEESEAWVNTGALMNRMNFALALAAGKIPGVIPNNKALEWVDLSETTRRTIEEKNDARVKAGLILGSPEFQRQ